MKKYGINGNIASQTIYGVGGVNSIKTYGKGGEFVHPIYGDINPSELAGLEAWYRQGVGITVTGAGISQWDDQSGNDRHLVQTADASRPSKESDGSALCDGIDDFLDGGIAIISQPHTVYALVKLITWTANDVVIGFGGGTNRFIYQSGISPQIKLDNGALLGSISPTLGGYNVISAVSNSTSSLIQLDKETPASGNAGTNDIGRIVLGTNNLVTNFAHAQYKEYIIYSGAHDAATRSKVISYLSGVGGL